MNSTRVTLQPAYVLHGRSYRESSRLLRIFTPEYGKVSLLVKGARGRNSNFAGTLQPFNRLRVSWVGKSDLKIMTGAELVSAPLRLRGNLLFCGLYLNELVERFLENQDPHFDLFVHYSEALQKLADNSDVELTLRCFEFSLLEETGYGLQVEREAESRAAIDADKCYRYQFGRGPIAAAKGTATVCGATLIGLREKRLENAIVLREAKRLMRAAIDYHLGSKPLKSRGLFKPAGTS